MNCFQVLILTCVLTYFVQFQPSNGQTRQCICKTWECGDSSSNDTDTTKFDQCINENAAYQHDSSNSITCTYSYTCNKNTCSCMSQQTGVYILIASDIAIVCLAAVGYNIYSFLNPQEKMNTNFNQVEYYQNRRIQKRETESAQKIQII